LHRFLDNSTFFDENRVPPMPLDSSSTKGVTSLLAAIDPPAFWAAGHTPADSEEGRALLQVRISRFGRFGFTLNAVFYFLSVLFVGALNIDGRGFTLDLLVRDMETAVLVAVVVYGAQWLLTRRGKIGVTGLHAIDINAIVLVSIGLCYGVWSLPVHARPELVVLLTESSMLAIRAVMIPSSAVRSAWIALAAVTPAILLTYFYYDSHSVHYGTLTPLSLACVTAFLASPIVIVSSYISNTIYGLTERVREAKQLGQYTLDEKIGEGGMGVVFKARHSMLRRPTAVKLLPPQRAGEHNLIRFEREVQLTSMLTHPNTIAIYDFGRTPEGVFYYAMEYLDGIDLEKLVEQDGPLDPPRTIHILQQVAAALAEAHGIGLIHRDIKPANIILCERGPTPDVAKVLDFGLVKRMEPSTEDPARSAVNAITGTPLFLSPEAILTPDKVDGRSDLYGLGCVGYFLLTGTHVFDAATVVEICGHHVHSIPVLPSERLGRRIPSDLEQIILSCLEKVPDRRPQDAWELVEALRTCDDHGAWDPKRARQWWKDRGRHLKKRADGVTPDSAARPRTMNIDLRTRASQG
jgi:eukaryotic-like serine/threonine-protein kinase